MDAKEKALSALIDAVLKGEKIYYITYVHIEMGYIHPRKATKTTKAELVIGSGKDRKHLCSHEVDKDTDFRKTVSFQEAKEIIDKCLR